MPVISWSCLVQLSARGVHANVSAKSIDSAPRRSVGTERYCSAKFTRIPELPIWISALTNAYWSLHHQALQGFSHELEQNLGKLESNCSINFPRIHAGDQAVDLMALTATKIFARREQYRMAVSQRHFPASGQTSLGQRCYDFVAMATIRGDLWT